MKICALHHLPWQIVLCHILTIHFVNEAHAKLGHVGWAKSDSRTRQILQNIRSRIAQQEEEEQQQKECDPKLPSCKLPKKYTDEEESVERASEGEIIPPLRFKTRHKTAGQLKKDLAHAVAIKDYKAGKKTQVAEEKDGTDNEVKRSKIKEVDKETKKTKLEPAKIKTLSKKSEDDSEEETKPKVRLKRTKVEEETKPKSKEKIIKQDSEEETKPKLKDKRIKQALKEEKKPQLKKKDEPKIKLMKPAIEKKGKKTEEPVKKKMLKKLEKSEKPVKEKPEETMFPEDFPVFSLTTDSVKSKRCKDHSKVYLKQLKRYKLWALMMYDSTAKLPAGVLQGNVNQYGDFDQCISVNATFKKASRDGVSGIEGKYCLATIDISSDSTDPGLQNAIYRSQSYNFVKSKISDPGHFIPRFSTINWGLCIPSVCKAEDLENSIKSSLSTYEKKSGLEFDVKVEDKNCVTKNDLLSEYDAKTYITLLFYGAVVGAAVYATLKDVKMKKIKNGGSVIQELEPSTEQIESDASSDSDGEPPIIPSYHGKLKALVMAFSLKRNLKKLFVEGESEDNINCIHGIKSIFTVMLFFAHKTIPLALTPFSNRVVFTEVSNLTMSVLLRGSIIYTDSFLLISGVLVSFNLCKEIHKHGRILWFRRIIARFIRLTPALLATLLFYSYISNYLGSGPIWNLVIGENSKLCRESMWKNLFYIQNFYPFEEMCAPQTHQLALDMQLFLLSPIFVYLLYEYDKIGIGILQAFLMFSSILRFLSTTDNELSLFIFHGMPISQLYKTADLLYTQPLHRATPYVVGILVGYYLQKLGKNFKLPNLLVIFGWILSISLALSTVFAPANLTKQKYEYDLSEAAHYAALAPIAWSLALGWFITASHLGYGGKLNAYLSNKGFIIFSRISYSVYLLQFLVFSHTVASKRIPEIFSVLGSINVTEMVLIVVISVIATLLFDIPTVEIKRIILELLPGEKPTAERVLRKAEVHGINTHYPYFKSLNSGNVSAVKEVLSEEKVSEIVEKQETYAPEAKEDVPNDDIRKSGKDEKEEEEEKPEDLNYGEEDGEEEEEAVVEDNNDIINTEEDEEDEEVDFWGSKE